MNLKQSFEELTPDYNQKKRMLQVILDPERQKMQHKLPLFTKAALAALGIVVVTGSALAYNEVKRVNKNEDLYAASGIFSETSETYGTADDFSGMSVVPDISPDETTSVTENHLFNTDDTAAEQPNYVDYAKILTGNLPKFTDAMNDGEYYISDEFEGYIGHKGIDLAAPSGTKIYAAADGEVVLSEWYYNYGYCVIIDHGDGVRTLYSQCSELLVEVNAEVKKGDLIALVGQTGMAIGNHLHFELRINDTSYDPRWATKISLEIKEFYKIIDNLTTDGIAEYDSEVYKSLLTQYKQAQSSVVQIYSENNKLPQFTVPLKDYLITAEYMPETHHHHGVDFSVDTGTKIYAAAGGVIKLVYADDGFNDGYGNYVVIDHGNGITTLYSHCSEILVEAEQEVKQGEPIALSGSTGWSTGPHLHFEFRIDDIPFDPCLVIDLR